MNFTPIKNLAVVTVLLFLLAGCSGEGSISPSTARSSSAATRIELSPNTDTEEYKLPAPQKAAQSPDTLESSVAPLKESKLDCFPTLEPLPLPRPGDTAAPVPLPMPIDPNAKQLPPDTLEFRVPEGCEKEYQQRWAEAREAERIAQLSR